MNRYIQEIFGSTESDFMSDTKESALSLAMNQYETYWNKYYGNSVFSGVSSTNKKILNSGVKAHKLFRKFEHLYESVEEEGLPSIFVEVAEDIAIFGRVPRRRFRRRWHHRRPRRWRRHLRPYRWHQPIIVVEQNPRTAIGGLLVALSDKINLLWSSMTEEQRLQWRKTREKKHQKSPRLLFSKYPLPAGLV